MNLLIKLSEQEPFARGGNRACYVDPRDSTRCIKVPLEKRSASVKRQKASGFKKFRPLYCFDDNTRELNSYRSISRACGEAVWTHLPKCYGLIDTDLGKGIVTDLVRNVDGSICGCLKSILRETGDDAGFRYAVAEFNEYLRKTLLPTRDLLLHNLVGCRLNDGRLKIYLVDGFGSSDLMPYAYWFDFLAERKVERKIQRFSAKISEFSHKYGIPSYK